MTAFLPPDQFPKRGEPFRISSDKHAVYTIVDVRIRADGMVEVETVRRGRAGQLSWSERLIDRQARTFTYLRDADDEDEFLSQHRNPDEPMAPFVEGSISDLVARHAERLVVN